MTPKVVEVAPRAGFVLFVRFADGVAGEVDLAAELSGPVFEPLRDPARFREASVHPDLHTVTWPNGADLAPEFLYEQVRVPA